MTASPSWAELEELLDVPHVTEYDEQIRVMREWRADNLAQLAAIRGKTFSSADDWPRALVEACYGEIDLCERFLADRDEPFEAPDA